MDTDITRMKADEDKGWCPPALLMGEGRPPPLLQFAVSPLSRAEGGLPSILFRVIRDESAKDVSLFGDQRFDFRDAFHSPLPSRRRSPISRLCRGALSLFTLKTAL
jgi:hypothetical protein